MTPTEAATAKEAAADYAVRTYIGPGVRLGLGSGSTAAFAVHALARRIEHEGLVLSGVVSTSSETAQLARSLGISLSDDLTPDLFPLDVTIDGADEVDAAFHCIKGGGGALLREKIVAVATLREVIVVDASKFAGVLGNIHPLPVMVVPYGWELTKKRLENVCERPSQLRKKADGSVFISNDGLFCLDVQKGDIPDPDGWEIAIKAITGVVDVGLFVDIARNVVVGHSDGRVTEPAKAIRS